MLPPLILWAVIISLVFPILALVSIPLAIWRLIVNIIVFLRRKDLIASLTSRDLAFTSDDPHGKSRKTVINCTVIDGPATVETLKKVFQSRILDNEYYNRLNCRPAVFLGYWFWQKITIQLDDYITDVKEKYTDEVLRSFLVSWVEVGFPAGSALWRMKLIPLTNNKTAIVTKIHHLYCDGVSFMKLLQDISDGGWKNLETPECRPFSLAHWMYAWYNFPWKALKAYRLAQIRKGFRPKVYYGDGLTSCATMPLDKIRVIRKIEKCTFPTVLASILTQAIHRLWQNSGKAEIPKHIRMVVPTPWPDRSVKRISNHAAWLHAEAPLGHPDVIRKFEASVKYSYTSGLHGIMWEIFKGLYLIPKPCLAVYTAWGERNLPAVILSSIPGSLVHVPLMGHKVLQSYPVLSLGCSTGMNAAFTTYADEVYASVRVSKEIFQSQEMLDQLLNKYLQEELEDFYNKAMIKKAEQLKDHVQIAIP